ncbi:MAG: acyl-ACP--UDP-N-acetylglucosamine O-acyltransferase [Planctomycetota bacterium]|jgi:UDP-N-acetylglucosamine acyltransferase
MAIHPMAVVDPAAQVDESAAIGPFCMVGPGVTIGPDVELRSHVSVMGKTTIGAGTIVFPGAVLGGDPQDLKFRGEDSEVIIGTDCRIHECATVNKGTATGGMLTSLGDQVLVMAYAHIAHDCRVGDNVVIGNNTQLAGHVVIGRRAVISGMVGMHHFVTVGELAFVAAMSGVRTDVPPYLTVEGYPSEARSVNVVGMRRDGWSDADISATREAFRHLFRKREGTVVNAVAEVRASELAAVEPVERLCAWLLDQAETGIKGRVQESAR